MSCAYAVLLSRASRTLTPKAWRFGASVSALGLPSSGTKTPGFFTLLCLADGVGTTSLP